MNSTQNFLYHSKKTLLTNKWILKLPTVTPIFLNSQYVHAIPKAKKQ